LLRKFKLTALKAFSAIFQVPKMPMQLIALLQSNCTENSPA
jgi:hypothetical protein